MTDIINKEKILEHAKMLAGEGKFDRAIEEYNRLLEIDPADLRIKIKVAELFVKRKQIQDAIRIYMEVARAYADGSFYLKAVTIYKSILRLNPSLVDVNIALSELYEKMGLVQDALHQYQIVAMTLEQKGDAAGMLNIRERMVALDPGNTSLRVRLAETYQLQGEAGKAIEMYEMLAEQLKNSSDIDQLIELYNKILAHRPDRHDLVKLLCHMYFKRGEWKEILKRMEDSKDFAAQDSELLSMHAGIYARLNQLESAKRKYHDLVDLFIEQKDIDGAISTYEQLLFWGPEDEENIAKEVEALKPGAFKDVLANVSRRRKRAEEEDLKREEFARAAGTIDAAAGQIDTNEAGDVKKKADSSYELGTMYKKTGLDDEARLELEKAFNGYRRLMGTGLGNEIIAGRFRELDAIFGERREGPADVKPAPVKEPVVSAKKNPPREPEQKTLSGSAKKKISFV